MTFAEATAIIEGETSSHITKMIEELTQLEGSEVPRINTEAVPMNLAAVAGESYQLGDLSGICKRVYHLQFFGLVRYKNF